MTKRRIWTAEKVEEFAAMVKAGTPLRLCGRLLKVGESSAIGKAWRLKNSGDDRFALNPRSPLNRPRRSRKSRAVVVVPPEPPTPAPPRPPCASAKRPPIRMAWVDPRQLALRIDPVGKRLLDLRGDECHFLIGAQDYCALPVEHGSLKPYCPCHRKVMYRPASRRAA